jgi:hypothetical protein
VLSHSMYTTTRHQRATKTFQTCPDAEKVVAGHPPCWVPGVEGGRLRSTYVKSLRTSFCHFMLVTLWPHPGSQQTSVTEPWHHLGARHVLRKLAPMYAYCMNARVSIHMASDPNRGGGAFRPWRVPRKPWIAQIAPTGRKRAPLSEVLTLCTSGGVQSTFSRLRKTTPGYLWELSRRSCTFSAFDAGKGSSVTWVPGLGLTWPEVTGRDAWHSHAV